MRAQAFFVLFLVLATAAVAQEQSAEPNLPASCKVSYYVIQEDTLHNINQGLLAVFSTTGTVSGSERSPKKALKDAQDWLKKMAKKYPDVCYVSANEQETIEFVILTNRAVYHGTSVQTYSSPTSSTSTTTGTLTDDEGNSASIDAQTETTGTTSSSVGVPYETPYNVLTLTVERKRPDGHFEPLRRFQMSSLHPVIYGISFGKGKHPIANVMEEAIKWIHEGGLNNPAQSIVR